MKVNSNSKLYYDRLRKKYAYTSMKKLRTTKKYSDKPQTSPTKLSSTLKKGR